jgi:hypothetical protein
MTVPIVFGRLKLPPRDARENLTHLTMDERVDSHPCICEDCIRQRPERRALKIAQLAEAKRAMRFLERM